MAVDEGDLEIMEFQDHKDDFEMMNFQDLHDLTLDDLSVFSNFHEFPENQLCVPPDSIDDLEWFPSFTDDFISLNESSVCFDSAKPNHRQPLNHDRDEKTEQEMEKDRVGISEAELGGGFRKKKGRTKMKAKRGLVGIKRKRCSHCETEETPQWRVGPLGPKTLCNACGVRFKSGRLVPEYRPAASPTFDGCRHSNYHKKILRRRGLDR